MVLAVLRPLVGHRHARVRRLWDRYVHRLHAVHCGRGDCVSGLEPYLDHLLSFKREWRDCIPAYGWNRYDAGNQLILVRRDFGYSEVVETYTRSVRKL